MKSLFIVLILFLVFMGSIIFWQSLNKDFFTYDSLRHYLNSVALCERGQTFNEFLTRLTKYSDRYFPAVYALNSLFYNFFEPTQQMAVLINDFLFIPVLLLSVFGIGRIIKDEKCGILACIIILLLPIVFNQAKIYMLDLPLLAIVSLNTYFLLKAEFFARARYVLLYILSFALGMLVKPNFLFFALGPFIYSCYKALEARKLAKLRILVYFSSVILLLLVIWNLLPDHPKQLSYGIGSLKIYGMIITWLPAQFMAAPFYIHKIRGLLWYIWGFINWQAGFLVFIYFIFGVIKISKSDSKYKALILTWVFSGYFLLVWFLYAIDLDMQVTGIRYTLPLMGSVAVIIAFGVSGIQKRAFRHLAKGVLLSYLLLSYLFLSYPLLAKPVSLRINLKQDRYHLLPGYLNILSTEPLIISGTEWLSHPRDKSGFYSRIEGLFNFFDKQANGRTVKILLLSDNADWRHFKYLSHKYGKKNLVFYCDYSRFSRYLRYDYLKTGQCDFVVEIKDGFTEPYLRPVAERLRKDFEELKEKFVLVKEDELCRIYQRNRD